MAQTYPLHVGTSLVFSLLLLAPTAHAAELARYEAAQRHMGSVFQIAFYAADDQAAAQAFRTAFDRIAALDRALSDYNPESELSQLSAAAPTTTPRAVSDELWTVLCAAQQISVRSEGAFDVTVGPLTTLWRKARRSKSLPEREALVAALAAVGHQHVELHSPSQSVTLKRKGMRLDLGGIAKGYALDEALTSLRKLGVTRALINGGGDLAMGDPPPGKSGWTIGVAPLAPDDPPSRTISVANCGVATSGDAWQFVEIDGRRYSHIVDLQTGLGLTDRSSVTVIAPTGMLADGLASAVSVLGPAKGIAIIEQAPQAAALIVRAGSGEAAEVHQSQRFGDFIKQQPDDVDQLQSDGKPLSYWRERLVDFDATTPDAATHVPVLTAIAADTTIDDITRRNAALALGRIGKPAEAAIPILVRLCDEPAHHGTPPGVWSLKALAQMGPHAESATSAIIRILNDEQRSLLLRMVAVEALAQIGGAHPDAVPELVRWIQSRPGDNEADRHRLRELAVEALGVSGADAALAVPLLVRIIGSVGERDSTRRQAVVSLGSIGPPAMVAIDPLAETLVFDASSAVRDAAAKSLAQIGPPAAPTLIALLRHRDSEVRWRAADALGEMTEPPGDAVVALQSALADREALVRLCAAESLAQQKVSPKTLLKPVVRLLASDQREIRFRALKLLDEFGTAATPALSDLRQLTTDPRRVVRQAAEKAIERIETK